MRSDRFPTRVGPDRPSSHLPARPPFADALARAAAAGAGPLQAALLDGPASGLGRNVALHYLHHRASTSDQLR
jgi:hypothetical protein